MWLAPCRSCTGNAKGHEQKEGTLKYSKLFATELADTFEEFWLPVRQGLEQHQRRGTEDEDVARWRASVQREQAASSASGQPSSVIKPPAAKATSGGDATEPGQHDEDKEEEEGARVDTEAAEAAEAAVQKRKAAIVEEKKMASSANKLKRQKTDQVQNHKLPSCKVSGLVGKGKGISR